jgi:hypothetical protein
MSVGAAVASGIVTGVVVTIGSGLAFLHGLARNMGALLGFDGTISSVKSSGPGWGASIGVVVLVALLYALRRQWWTPPVARVTAGLVVTVVVIVGSVQTDDWLLRDLGVRPWWDLIAPAASQSLVAWAFVGVVAASLASDALRRARGELPAADDAPADRA